MKRFFIFLFLTGILINDVFGQADSVTIRGTLMNLSGRLYREASSITFSRNNILAPTTEFSVNAPLQPDGSFTAKLPILAGAEEIYLDYGGKVFATFLAKAGVVEITFDADSMFKAKKLFHFKGEYADANNYYPAYLEQENKLYEANRPLGPEFQRTFWNQGLQSARQTLLQRGNLRQRALTALLSEGKQSPDLTLWVNSLVEDESAALLMEYSLGNDVNLNASDHMEMKRFITTPLTYQKVLRAQRFKAYAARTAERLSGRNAGSLPVEKIAELVLRYVSPLSTQERDKLRLILEKKNVNREELDFMSNIYKRGGEKLILIANFERSVAAVREHFEEGPALEFLIASAFADNFYQYTLEEKKILFEHLKDKILNATIKLSLEELYRLEVKDSANIQLVWDRPSSENPVEILPNIWLAESNQNGKSWLDKIIALYQGRTIYVMNWDLYNDMNREDLASANFLRASVPRDVVFLFLHVTDPDRPQLEGTGPNRKERNLWKQYIVRHNLLGTHLYLNADQVMQLGLRTPYLPGTYYIIRPDGKFHSRNAPSPQNIAEAAAAIRTANHK